MHKRYRTLIQRDWWSFLVAVGVPPFIVLCSLYIIGTPDDFAVWQYAPPAIATLSIIESSRVSDIVGVVTTNHITTLFVWGVTRIISVPQYAFIVLYMVASSMTAAVSYVVARITTVERTWAMVLAIAFTLAPARFWFVNISDHWWMSIPLVWLVVYQWWYQPLSIWRRMYPYMLPLMVIPWLGWEHLLWSVVGLLLAAMIAATIRAEWSWIQFAYAVIPMGLMSLVLYGVYPIGLPVVHTDGLRLLDLVVPHRTHWLSWLANLGERLYQLEIPRTSTVYGGIMAIVGIIVLVVRAPRKLASPNVVGAQSLLAWLASLVLLANINGWMLLFVWGGLPVISPQPVQLIVVFAGLFVLVQWLQQHLRGAKYVVVLVMCVIFVDQVPSTNIMRHMRQTPQEIPSTQLTDGVWFGQLALPVDVVSVSGLSTIDPGYGRWSDAAVADRIQIVVRDQLRAPVTLEIRARGVGINVGTPIVVRIGTEEQTMILDTTVRSYVLTFTKPQGTVIEIIPQPVDTPPVGDVRRIGVFMQSMRVVSP